MIGHIAKKEIQHNSYSIRLPALMVISAILFAINTYVKGHDLGEIAQKHSDSASELWNIREEYFSLLTDILAKMQLDKMVARIIAAKIKSIEELMEYTNIISKKSLNFSTRCYAFFHLTPLGESSSIMPFLSNSSLISSDFLKSFAFRAFSRSWIFSIISSSKIN